MPPRVQDISDIESYWKDLRVKEVQASSTKTPLEEMLDAAAEATLKDLQKWQTSTEFYRLQEGANGQVARAVVRGLRSFMSQWYEIQKKQDIGVLIEIILEGQDIPVEDVKGFVRALPRSIINRILKELRGQATGLHALLSIEALYRDGTLREDYTLRIDMDKKLVASFFPKEEVEPLTFTLHEMFVGPSP